MKKKTCYQTERKKGNKQKGERRSDVVLSRAWLWRASRLKGSSKLGIEILNFEGKTEANSRSKIFLLKSRAKFVKREDKWGRGSEHKI